MVRQLLITVPLLALWIMSSFAAAQQLPLAQELAEPPLLSDLATLSGTAPQAGDSDGLGSAARLNSPSGLSISADGSFALLVEEGSTKLKRIDIANGQVSTLINTLPGAYSVALSPDASFALIATGRHQTIERVELPSGAISLVAGEAGQSGSANGVSDYAQFNMPTSVAISPDSSFALVADSNNHTIRRIDLASRVVMTLTGRAEYSGTSDGYGADARFQVPTGVAISSDASFALVADSRNATIRRIDLATNMVTTIAGQAGQYGCTDGIGRAARFEQPSATAMR
jgi:DNA-binding beta-propeller fold protein YncE